MKLAHLIPAALGAAAGAAIGATVWAATAYFLHVEIGWIAWGVGVLAGLGAKLGARGDTSREVGVAAAAVALLGVAAGKVLTVAIAMSAAGGVDDELLISYVADVVAEEQQAEGADLAWPRRETPYPERQADYPPPVWTEALARWRETPVAEREAFRAEIQASLDAASSEHMMAGFTSSWGALDVLFVFLAVSSAFKIAQGAALRST